MGELNILNSDTHDTPTSGYSKLYPKTDKNFYIKDDEGNESVIGGESNSAINVGGANEIFNDKVGVNLQFKTLSAGDGIEVTSATDTLTFSVSGGQVTSIFGETGIVTQINSASFDPNYTSAGNPPHQEGLMFYDNVNKTHALYGDQSDVTLQLGQEMHVRVCNRTGSTIPNGSAVQITSATGGLPCVSLAIANIGNAEHYVGLVTHDILDGQNGLVTIHGTISDVNTSAYNAGDVLYLSTSTSGAFQTTKPISPYPVIEIGHVITSNATTGKILVTKDEKPLETPFEKVLYIATSGTDSTDVDGTELKPYKTIKYALSTITDNSDAIRYVILIGPGVFNEINPIQMKEYVSIKAIGGSSVTRIQATIGTSGLFYGTARSELSNMALQHTSGFCFEMNETLNTALNDIAFTNSKGWVKVNHPTAEIQMTNPATVTSPFGGTPTVIGFQVDSGVLRSNNTLITSVTSATTVVSVSGSNSRLEMRGFECDSSNINNVFDIYNNSELDIKTFDIRDCTSAINVSTSGSVNLFNGFIKNCDQGIYVNGSSSAEIFGVACKDCTLDLVVTSGSDVNGAGNGFRTDRMQIDENADLVLSHISDFPGDEGFEVKGELHVGTPEQPKETVLGEGDSYTRDMFVYIGDATSAITDVTTSAQSFGGSTFTFSANTVGQCVYMTSDKMKDSDYLKHLGVKVSIDTSATNGVIDVEYWNGSAWVHVDHMYTDSSGQYYPYGELTSAGSILAKSYQVRYDNNLSNGSWAKNDPNGSGTNRYWIRWRITKTFNQLPVFEQIKLHSNRFEVNGDGWIEYFGKARPLGTLPWSVSQLGRNTALGNQSVFLGDNLSVSYLYNLFNTNGDKAGFQSALPLDCDTSTPISFRWAVRPAGTGNITWTVRWSYSNDGDTIYDSAGSAPTSAVNEQSVTTSGSIVEGQQKWFSVDLNVSKLIPRKSGGFPDYLWISLERTTSDANVAIFALDPEYTKWSEGGHI